MNKSINNYNYKTIYGLNNCINCLRKFKKYRIVSIIINKDSNISKNKNISSLISKSKIKPIYLDYKSFNNKYNFKHTQGIIINFNGDLTRKIDEISTFDNNSCFIIADQMTDPQNLGQIIRTAECAGINGIILPKHKSVHITNSVLQVSQGAFFNLDIFVETNLNNTIKYLQSKGFWIFGLENSISADNWYNMDYKGKIAIVIGGEGNGIRNLIKKSCDFLTTIPMKGKINSLNVTAATSAILFERQRQLDISK